MRSEQFTTTACIAPLTAYVDGRLSIGELCDFANELWDAVKSDAATKQAEEESLLWAVGSALQATCLVEAFDHDLAEIDESAVQAVVQELLIYLDEGEDEWRRKVQSGWWPW